jgi:hypothetical protein
VIINAHNFTPLWTPAVNGKMPVAAWVPSRDTAGNGTTTLTDLVGSNNGTLTNMDAATDWVSDTGAGGVRALDFDGTNDYVLLSSTAALGSTYSLAFWCRPAGYGRVLIGGDSINSYGFYLESTLCYHRVANGTFGSRNYGGLTLNTWTHFMLSRSGGTVTVYKNGLSVGAMAATFNAVFSCATLGCQSDLSFFFSGRLDDIRFFTTALDASDAAYLATSRGI